MKRLVAFIDCAAVCVAMLAAVALIAFMLRGLFFELKGMIQDLHAARSDWWIAGLVLFLLLWAAFRWRQGLRALHELSPGE